MIKMKFWKHVEARLLDIENTSAYYAGGTLSLPLGDNRGICLNIGGKGFVLNSKLKSSTVYQPEVITALVRKIYLDVKGCTDFFKKVEKEFPLNY